MKLKNESHEGNYSRATPSFRSPHVMVEIIKENSYVDLQLINITYRKIFLIVNNFGGTEI